MVSNFDFLKKDFPVLSNFGKMAEKYCYSDSNSCLMKLGMIGETIVNLMFTYDRIAFPHDNTAVARIDTLSREGLLTSDLVTILHGLRKVRNKAVHENYASIADDKIFLPMAHSLCEWFMQTYGDWNYSHRDFVMPEENTVSGTVDKEAEEKKESELTKLAEQMAAAAPIIEQTERKKQAYKAANQRPKTEAETRFLIDEQLRMVGWDADTENLRYSKGTRPTKGRNLAIAEYPTNSKVGNRGYADYALFVGEKLVGIIEAKAIDSEIPFEIPDGWMYERLGNICSIARGGSPRPIENYLTDDENGLNWIKIGDTEQGGKYIYSTKEKIRPEGLSKTRYVCSGDFLLTNSMSFGRPYILRTNGCIHDGWLVIGGIEIAFHQDYLYYMLSSSIMYNALSSLAVGSTVKNLKSDSVKSLLVPIPPLAEQACISRQIENYFATMLPIERSLS